MRLATRIAGFEWMLVAMLISVCALSIELIGQGSRNNAKIIREDARALELISEMREAIWRYEAAAARIDPEDDDREAERASRDLYAARSSFARALDQAREASFTAEERSLLDSLAGTADRYFTGQEAVEAVLQGASTLSSHTRRRIETEANAAIVVGQDGITLIATFGVIAVLLALLLAARASRRITQPLETLHRTVIALTDPSNGDRRVPDGDYDETLRELGKAVNVLAERLESAERAPDHERALMVATADRVIETLPSPVVVVDLSGCLRLTNQAARDLLEIHSPDELGIPGAVRAGLSGDLEDAPIPVQPLKSRRGTSLGFALTLSAPKTI